jgi:acyl-coenzyme A thioesterase PaaI-like protein
MNAPKDLDRVDPATLPRLVSRRQPGSALCFVCGTENPHGLRLVFHDDGRTVSADVTAADHHQSWPGVLHGGITSAILDETIARVAFIHDRWVHTARLVVRFLKPAPLGQLLLATGELARDARLLMEMRGKLVLAATGEVLAEATGTFVPLPQETREELARKLGGDFAAWEEWMASHRARATVVGG